jgi:hypothetical protein
MLEREKERREKLLAKTEGFDGRASKMEKEHSKATRRLSRAVIRHGLSLKCLNPKP